MSLEIFVVLSILLAGILAATAYIAFNRWFDAMEQEQERGEDESEFMIGPYRELREKLAKIRMSEDPREELAMTPADILDLVEALEAEVNNGGFDQFFFNSSGDYALETIDALKIIEADLTADLVQLACDRFPDGRPPLSTGERRALMLDVVSPEADTFEDLDTQFYKYEDPLFDLVSKYKEKHSL